MSKLKIFIWVLALSLLFGGMVALPVMLKAAQHIVQTAKVLGNWEESSAMKTQIVRAVALAATALLLASGNSLGGALTGGMTAALLIFYLECAIEAARRWWHERKA
jgi:energy-converting hydrogenase Eha subunit B